MRKSRITSEHWLLCKPIAHRGLFDNKTVPENSLKAFGKCVYKNIPIELDVRLTQDNSVVVFHDDELRRMTGRQGSISKIDSIELAALRLVNTDERIPNLVEALEFVSGKVPLLIEIKNEGAPGKLEQKVAELLRFYKGEVAIQSFNPYSLQWFKRHAPRLLRGQLSGDFRDKKLSLYRKFILKRLLMNLISKPDFIAFDIRALPNKKVQKVRKKGIPLLAWTIRNKQEEAKAEIYADNVITEYI
jgi:glycerophosphoryl diester phosphodiesterase